MKFINTILRLCFLLFFINILTAQATPDYSKPSLFIQKIEQNIDVTGKLDNPVWAKIEPFELNYEIRPGDNLPAKEKTKVRVFYTESHLYFGFECYDSDPSQIRANLSDRDRIFQDDYVIIILDTYGDFQKGYEFAVNPLGIQGDLLATSDNEDSSIDYIWEAAANINENGWTAEMAIPFRSLSFSENDLNKWVMNIVRTIPRAYRTQIAWTKIDRNLPGLLPQSGLLQGLQNVKSGSSIELLPYLMGQKNGTISDFNNPASGLKYSDIEGRIGGSVKYSPSPNFFVDAVINPDFSQIESDAAQISVNTTFALNYEEKRPFFLIGRELLQTPMYYSRSINNPLAAGRVMGKAGKLSYLYLGAYDRNTVIEIPGEERSNVVASSLKSMANIGRLRYDFGNENYVGAMLFSRNLKEGHNYLVGFDWNYKFWNNWYFSGEGFLSQTKEINDLSLLNTSRKLGNTEYSANLDGENYSGSGIHLVLSHSSRNYNFNVGFNNFSPTFQTYNGLFSSTGYRQLFTSHTYIIYFDDKFVERINFGLSSSIQYNFENIKKEQTLQPRISIALKGQTNLFLSYLLVNDEKFHGTQFNKINRTMFDISSRPFNGFEIYTGGQIGKFIFRSNNPRMGFGHNLYASVTVKPTANLNLSFSYDRAKLSDDNTGQLFYEGNIYRFVGIYNFSPRLFFRTILQYNDFDQSFQVYPLISYKINAFTTFYAGATSDYLDYQSDHGFVRTSQQFFIKLQYLLGV